VHGRHERAVVGLLEVEPVLGGVEGPVLLGDVGHVCRRLVLWRGGHVHVATGDQRGTETGREQDPLESERERERRQTTREKKTRRGQKEH
jgi:hypothetical protein